MSRFGPGVVPRAGQALDFSPLGEALDRMGARRSMRRREELEDTDVQMKVRAAGGRPMREVIPQRREADLRESYRGLDQSFRDSFGPTRTPATPGLTPGDPYAGESGVGREELGGVHGGASAAMRTTSGATVAEYLRPYRMTIRGEEYEFDPMHSARVKAAETDFEEDAEVQRMRGLGMTSEQIARSKYPDRNLSFEQRRELKTLDIAGRAEVQRQRTILAERKLSLEARRIAMMEAARNNAQTYAQERIAYLREKMAFDAARDAADFALREYGISARQLEAQDPTMMDDEALAEAEREIAATRRRAQSAVGGFNRTRPGAAAPAPAAAPRDSTSPAPAASRGRPRNPYAPPAR